MEGMKGVEGGGGGGEGAAYTLLSGEVDGDL